MIVMLLVSLAFIGIYTGVGLSMVLLVDLDIDSTAMYLTVTAYDEVLSFSGRITHNPH